MRERNFEQLEQANNSIDPSAELARKRIAKKTGMPQEASKEIAFADMFFDVCDGGADGI